jgi:hypothetical protein
MSELINISRFPIVYKGVHESIFRSYHILKQVKTMIERGDSAKTIIEAIDVMEYHKELVERSETLEIA